MDSMVHKETPSGTVVVGTKSSSGCVTLPKSTTAIRKISSLPNPVISSKMPVADVPAKTSWADELDEAGLLALADSQMLPKVPDSKRRAAQERGLRRRERDPDNN